jgi:hypothetical protein
MVVMGIAVKVAIGLVLLLPMTGYVVGSLVAAADPPREHAPIIVQEQTKSPEDPGKSPSAKPTKKPDDRQGNHGKNKGNGGDDGPVVVQPSPSVMDDDGDVFDDHGGLDNSGKGSGGGGGGGGDSSGKGSGDG